MLLPLATAPTSGRAHEPVATLHEQEIVLFVADDNGGSYVSVAFFVAYDGTILLSDALAEAEASIMTRFPGAIRVGASEVSAQFVLAGFAWPDNALSWSYNNAGKPQGITGDGEALQAATEQWNRSGAKWQFVGGNPSGDLTSGCQISGRDRKNTVGWVEQSGRVLAVTCTWFTTANPGVATEFDMEIDPGWSWTTGTLVQTDLQSIALHEFGHALGVNHTRERCPGPVMCNTYNSGNSIRQLTADDRAAIVSLYGASEIPTPSPTATPTTSPTRASSPTPAGTPTPFVRGKFRAVTQGVARD
jgi:hypothetical protein